MRLRRGPDRRRAGGRRGHGGVLDRQHRQATFDEGVWQFDIAPETDWPAGPVTVPMRDPPNLDDAAFKPGQSFSAAGAGHVDNYSDPSREDGAWRFDFDCLGFGVMSMA